MKHIKKFNTNIYWLIPTDTLKYKIALIKIGCNDPEMYDLKLNEFGDYVYVLKINDNHWEWEDDKDYYIDYTYMGIVNVEDYEVNSAKYNL